MFLNEDKRELKDLSAAEILSVVNGAKNKNLEYFDRLAEIWKGRDGTSGCLYLTEIYRVPPRKTKIDWSCINPELKYYTRDKNGKYFFSSAMPCIEAGDDYWEIYEGVVVESHLISDKAIQLGNEPWQESLIERPEGE